MTTNTVSHNANTLTHEHINTALNPNSEASYFADETTAGSNEANLYKDEPPSYEEVVRNYP